ncbi:alpha-mannosidase [Oceanispirochaeta crateris]|uniref:Alpha-mannosidase n=1 Tax=Oceanispirochaeta crateris TaxID=2518645 RepID=A0A5C1QKQ5_9SPIO|nr:alpha-mannosidase [Oceanispirochaeta crateris]QEN06722.1 alpha-mannosidase [Oceanispirochaeta crateris]
MNKKHRTHLIGNAHLDPVWLWRSTAGLAEIKATFQSALDRMAEFPDFIFTCSSAYYYKWVEDNAPEMFTEIKKYIEKGRWIPTGGMWIQPDCNIPSGESFVRQMLYSQRYFYEKFGLICHTGYNVDSFGHNGMLPQLLKLGGMNSYVFMRPMDHELEGLNHLFQWEGIDGSRVTTYKIPFSYGEWVGENGTNKEVLQTVSMKSRIDDVKEIGQNQDTAMMVFYGVGNHGGGPTIRTLNDIEKLKNEDETLSYSSPKSYFEEFKNIAKPIPVHIGDLQHHGSGCYSAHSQLKMLNCQAENRLMSAEKMMTTAASLISYDYDNSSLKRAWEEVMFNQFHDILAGTSIKKACDDAVESYNEALSIASRLRNSALQKVSWAVDTLGEENISLSKEDDWILWESENKGTPVVVFNPHSFPICSCIQVNVDIKGVTDNKGNAVAIQKVRGPFVNREDKYNTLFTGNIPPLGYSVFWIFKKKEFNISTTSSLSASESHLENSHIRVDIDPKNGWITGIFIKKSKTQILKTPACVPLIIDETECDTWGHGVYEFRNVTGKFGKANTKLLENGPLRSIVRVTSYYENSILQQDFTLYENKCELEVKSRIDLRMKHKMVKLSFPIDLTETSAVYEIPYGHIHKPANGQEEAAQRWVSVIGKTQKGVNLGFAIVNSGKYSYDIRENDLRMTIARTPAYADHFGERDDFSEYMDQGVQEFKYVICPDQGADYAFLSRRAQELNQELLHIIETYHKGKLPSVYSGIEISHENIILSVYKRNEDNTGTILRCYEAAGISTTGVTILLPGCKQRKIESDFNHNQIKTFLIPDKQSDEISEVSFLEMNLDTL